jgi:PTH1 family peptidyl-tRNA hydrolase
VIGLGNPGDRYVATRHNAGFRVLETWASRRDARWRQDPGLCARVASLEVAGEPVLLVQPQTFMNRSGETAWRALERWPELDPAHDLIIVYDDLDLPVGRIRLRPSGGSGGHRGLGDILDRLETRQLPRLRFGIGHPGQAAGVLDWVLQPFDAAAEGEILEGAFARAADALEAVVREGMTAAMGRFNAAPTDPAPDG